MLKTIRYSISLVKMRVVMQNSSNIDARGLP